MHFHEVSPFHKFESSSMFETKCRYGNAGAVWDIFRREDTPRLREYLERSREKFIHHGKPVSSYDVLDIINDARCCIQDAHRQELLQDYGIQSWHFEQHLNEAVIIPVGCPHQVRNLRSCIKASPKIPHLARLACILT